MYKFLYNLWYLYVFSCDFSPKLFNTLIGFLNASRTFLSLYFPNLLLPFAMWAAFPHLVLQLSLSIQVPQTTMEALLPCPYGFRQSPFSLIKTIAFRIVGYDFRHLHTTHGCSVLSIPQLYKMEIQPPRYCTFQLLSCRDKGYAQALAIVQAIQLLPSYTDFHSRSKAACQEILITALPPVISLTTTCYTPCFVSKIR